MQTARVARKATLAAQIAEAGKGGPILENAPEPGNWVAPSLSPTLSQPSVCLLAILRIPKTGLGR
jgi:hypothetical protein